MRVESNKKGNTLSNLVPQVSEVAVEALTRVFVGLAWGTDVDPVEEESRVWARAAVSEVLVAYGLGLVSW